MSDEQQHPFQDPAHMRVNLYQAATQLAVGSPPQCGYNAAAPGKYRISHTHAGGEAASYLQNLADAESTRNNLNVTVSPAVPLSHATAPPESEYAFTIIAAAVGSTTSQCDTRATRHSAGFMHRSTATGWRLAANECRCAATRVAATILGEQSSDFGDDFAGGRSLDMEIVLDQVADLLTGSSARASSPLQ